MGKKVISFSLFGKHPAYTLGAVANVRHANRAYPGWVCRFYVADDVPEGIIVQLKDYGAEVINMGQRVGYEPSFWRFLATVDPENEIILFRDTDSRFTKCELLMVNEWLVSGEKFHVMRYDWYHRPILAGLWGVRGSIPNLKELLEGHLQSAGNANIRGTDELFLKTNLYPRMKGKVFVHEMTFQMTSQEKRRYFIEEPIHPFPPIARDERGKYLSRTPMPVGHVMSAMKSPCRIFIAFSIYKRTRFSEFLLALWLGTMEKSNLFRGKNINLRFYVADNISPGLIERLRRYGRVIIKSTKTVYDDDPQYWKLLILSEKNLGAAVFVDFWQIFFLERTRREDNIVKLYELPPIEYGLSSGIRSWFTNVSTLSICGPTPPVSDIENLIAQRDPNKNYREFIRSTVYPRTSTTRMTSVLKIREKIEPIRSLARMLFPSRLYGYARYLKTRPRPFKYLLG